MQRICLICWLALVGACAAPHAGRVYCDGKLRPINALTPPAAAPLVGAASGEAPNGAP